MESVQRSQNSPMPLAVILTALQVEYLAVQSYLSNLQEEIHPSGTIYERGKFFANEQEWEVVIASVGQGNAKAAGETQQAIDYYHPDILFFVGVAGGIKDVKIGDVVAGTKIYNYETGKIEEQTFTRIEAKDCTHLLVQRATVEARKSDWLKRLSQESEEVRQEKASHHASVFAFAIIAKCKINNLNTGKDIRQIATSNVASDELLADTLLQRNEVVILKESDGVNDERHDQITQVQDFINRNEFRQAVQYLENLRKRLWHKADDKIKYRLLANIGLSQLGLDEIDSAAKFFLEALQYNPEDDRALANAAMGYFDSPLLCVITHAYGFMESFHSNPFAVIFSRLVITMTHFPHS